MSFFSRCIDFVLETLIVAGPKVLEFANDFAAHKVAVLKADGIDIKSVSLAKRPAKRKSRGFFRDSWRLTF